MLNKSDAAVSSVLGLHQFDYIHIARLERRCRRGSADSARFGRIDSSWLECTVSGKDEEGGAVSTTKGDEFDSDVMKLIKWRWLEDFQFVGGIDADQRHKSPPSETYWYSGALKAMVEKGMGKSTYSTIIFANFKKYRICPPPIILAFLSLKRRKGYGS